MDRENFTISRKQQGIGVPIIPPYWALRLRPHFLPELGPWRHRLVREKDFTDLIDQEDG